MYMGSSCPLRASAGGGPMIPPACHRSTSLDDAVRTHRSRGRYVLRKPLRVLVTTKLPSASAEILIRYAGACAAAPPPRPALPPPWAATAGGASTPATVAPSSTLATKTAGA